MKKTIALVLALAALGLSLGAADLSVSDFSLLTHGRVNDAGLFVLSSRLNLDLSIRGGSKFAAWFGLRFQADDLESYFAAAAMPVPQDPPDPLVDLYILSLSRGLALDTAAMSLSNLGGSPLELTFFAGTLDRFCTGDDFTTLFGAIPFSTQVRGFMYYPAGVGGQSIRAYDGLHSVMGTGLRLGLPGQNFAPYLYLYQDLWLGPGIWSADARFLINSDRLKFEAFAGASFPQAEAGLYRAGLLFYFDTGSIGGFYAQVGLPRWDPTQALSADMLYFLFEPRIDFGIGSLNLSLFFHPSWYLFVETGYEGAIDMRADLNFGDLQEQGIRGGAEALVEYRPDASGGPVSVEAAPYMQLMVGGVRLDLRVGLELFPMPDIWYGMFLPSLGIQATF